MNSQKFNKNKSDNFDLDEYLEEKSNGEGIDSNQPDPQNEESSWLKNVLLITGLSIVTLLYFNDWSPSLAYGNIFGVEEYQNQTIVVADPAASDTKVIIVDPAGTNSSVTITGLSDLSELEEVTVSLEALEELEGLEIVSGEALATAFEALEGLENLENLERLESLEKLAVLENLEALGNIEVNIDPIEMQEIQVVTEKAVLEAFRALETLGSNLASQSSDNFNTNFSDYSKELTTLGLDDRFTDSSLQKFHQSEIPTSFLKKLDDLGLLDDLSTESIINAFDIENKD